MHTVYLSLGSNLGDREATIASACRKINELIGPIVRQSALHVTEPWGFESQHQFVNAAVCCLTILTPRQLLRSTQRIERMLGRRQKSVGGIYHDRPIDIDILLYDDITIDEPDLRIPHPLMHQRPFVMVPLQEILS